MAGIEATKATAAGEAKDIKSESDTRSKKDGRLVPTTDDDDRKTPKKRRKVNHGRWLASLLLPPTPYPLPPIPSLLLLVLPASPRLVRHPSTRTERPRADALCPAFTACLYCRRSVSHSSLRPRRTPLSGNCPPLSPPRRAPPQLPRRTPRLPAMGALQLGTRRCACAFSDYRSCSLLAWLTMLMFGPAPAHDVRSRMYRPSPPFAFVL